MVKDCGNEKILMSVLLVKKTSRVAFEKVRERKKNCVFGITPFKKN